jgi:hypothetical protein
MRRFCQILNYRSGIISALRDYHSCSCGAIALAAPTVDTDEIVDDALGIFAVQIREESRGYDALMLEDLRRSGVEIREGERTRVRWGSGVSTPACGSERRIRRLPNQS